MEKREKISQAEILKMGWTKSLISKFLPEPILVTNPYYKNAAPMKLWYKDIVLEIMEDENFKQAYNASLKRKASANKAVKSKKIKLEEDIDKLLDTITVKIVPPDELKVKTIHAKQSWYDENESCKNVEYCYQRIRADEIDEKTMNRWIVNYIRHNLISYDKGLKYMKNKVGCHEVYITFRNAVLEKIFQAYPMYEEECKRQMVISNDTYAENNDEIVESFAENA